VRFLQDVVVVKSVVDKEKHTPSFLLLPGGPANFGINADRLELNNVVIRKL